MKIILTEQQLLSLINEQGWTDPEKAASGPQKCGLTKGDGGPSREDRKADAAWAREVARQDKIDARDRATENKNFLSLSHDRFSSPLDRESRKVYFAQYQDFMKNNPGVIIDGDGFNSQQKYAAVSKALDFIRKAPQISYTVNLRSKFGLSPNSTLNDVIDVVGKMGGWESFINWFNAGGPKLK